MITYNYIIIQSITKSVSRAGGTPGWLLNLRSGTWGLNPATLDGLSRSHTASPQSLVFPRTRTFNASSPNALFGWAPSPTGHGQDCSKLRASNLPTSQPLTSGTDQESATIHPHCDRANHRARTQADPGPRYPNNRGPVGQTGLNVTLVPDSFPCPDRPYW